MDTQNGPWKRRMQLVAGVYVLIVIANLITLAIVLQVLGGSATACDLREGKFYLAERNSLTEVSEGTFLFVQWYEPISLLMMVPPVVFLGIAMFRSEGFSLRKGKAEDPKDSGHRKDDF